MKNEAGKLNEISKQVQTWLFAGVLTLFSSASVASVRFIIVRHCVVSLSYWQFVLAAELLISVNEQFSTERSSSYKQQTTGRKGATERQRVSEPRWPSRK